MNAFRVSIDHRFARLFLPALFALHAAGALGAALVLAGQKSEGQAFWLGYSLFRLAAVAATAALAALLLAAAAWAYRGSAGGERKIKKLAAPYLALAALAAAGLLMPAYFFPDSVVAYLQALRPILFGIALPASITLPALYIQNYGRGFLTAVSENRALLGRAGKIAAALLAAALLIASSGLGYASPEEFWYGAGVPVLLPQILLALAIGGALHAWRESIRKIKRFDWIASLLIFTATALLWASAPVAANFFMPRTGDNFLYPYSDSALFDAAAQQANIGAGLFGGYYFDRALYSALLAFLHLIAGQDYELLLALQAVIFAVFPVLVYFLGKEIRGVPLGASAAALLSMRGYTALIAAAWIDTASPKSMLTDFPAAIAAAAVLLAGIRWAKRPENGWLAFSAGGFLSIGVLLRTNLLALAPVIVLAVYGWGRPSRRAAIQGAAAFFLGLVLIALPWGLRNREHRNPLASFTHRIAIVLENRYPRVISNKPADPEKQPQGAGAEEKAPEAFTPAAADPLCSAHLCIIANHYAHNLVGSVLFYTRAFQIVDVWQAVKYPGSVFRPTWTGEGFGFASALAIAASLAAMALGLSATARENSAAAFLLAGGFLAYYGANAFGLTSGGRYLVPADWIPVIFFTAGLLEICILLLPAAETVRDPQVDAGQAVSVAPRLRFAGLGASLLVLAIGLGVPASDFAVIDRYQSAPAAAQRAAVQDALSEDPAFADLQALAVSQNAQVLAGIALYPRFYTAGLGEPDERYPFLELPEARLAFLVINDLEKKPAGVILRASGKPADLHFHGKSIWVLGCDTETHFEAAAVLLAETGQVIAAADTIPACRP